MSDIGRAWWRSTNPANLPLETPVQTVGDVIQEAVRQAKGLRDQGWAPQAVVLGQDEFDVLREATLRSGPTGQALVAKLAGLKVVVEPGNTGVTVIGNAPGLVPKGTLGGGTLEDAEQKARRIKARRRKPLLRQALRDLEERLTKARERGRRPVAIQVSDEIADLMLDEGVELSPWRPGEDGPEPPDCLGKLWGLPVIRSVDYNDGRITALGTDVQSLPQPTREDLLGQGIGPFMTDDSPPLGRPAVPMRSLQPGQERIVMEIEAQELALTRVGIKPTELWLSEADFDALNSIPGILLEYVADGLLFKGMRVTVYQGEQRISSPQVRGPKGERTSSPAELEAQLEDDPVWTDV